ncbi:MAG: hypothetical protein HC794_02015 [Nitrospiraceae bacterium]|nr:hypothetical protein [Nitrospiraceae bacterium]
MSQIEMFAPVLKPKAALPTPETVRLRVDAVLKELRDGTASGWPESVWRRWKVVFPQMCEWLPESERDAKRSEFQKLAANR